MKGCYHFFSSHTSETRDVDVSDNGGGRGGVQLKQVGSPLGTCHKISSEISHISRESVG